MELETLNALNERLQQDMLTLIEVVVWINILLVIIGFAVYLVGTVWLCFEETRQSMRGRLKPAKESLAFNLSRLNPPTPEPGLRSALPAHSVAIRQKRGFR